LIVCCGSTVAWSPRANGAITPSTVFRRASEAPLYRIEKRPALAKRQGAWAVMNHTGLILRRGHELEPVLRFFEKSRFGVIE
jgi:hypothetical protein